MVAAFWPPSTFRAKDVDQDRVVGPGDSLRSRGAVCTCFADLCQSRHGERFGRVVGPRADGAAVGDLARIWTLPGRAASRIPGQLVRRLASRDESDRKRMADPP